MPKCFFYFAYAKSIGFSIRNKSTKVVMGRWCCGDSFVAGKGNPELSNLVRQMVRSGCGRFEKSIVVVRPL